LRQLEVTPYAITTTIDLEFAEAVARLRERPKGSAS